MSESLSCYRCGASLEKLTLPLSQRDECPECFADLHVCKMCRHFDIDVPKKCREDDAEEVVEKERMNFCEWYVPSADAFDPVRAGKAAQARSELDALFGAEPAATPDTDELASEAEDLFK